MAKDLNLTLKAYLCPELPKAFSLSNSLPDGGGKIRPGRSRHKSHKLSYDAWQVTKVRAEMMDGSAPSRFLQLFFRARGPSHLVSWGPLGKGS